jgi:hypothetical protein
MSCVCLLLLLCFGKTLGAPLSVDRGAMVSVQSNVSITQHEQYIFIYYSELGSIMLILLSLPEAMQRQVGYSDNRLKA